MGATSHKAVTNRFPQEGGNRTSEAPGVVFDPTTRDEGVETPLPNDSLKASLSPPVEGRFCSFRRDWQTNKYSSNVINIITNGYVLPFLSKPNLVRFPLILSEYKGPSKSSGLLYPVSSVKERNWKGGKCKISWVLHLPVPSTQASPKVEASHRPKQAQHFSTCRKVQNGNSRVHQDLPDSRGMGTVDRPIRRLPAHPHPSKLRKNQRFCYKSQVFQFTSLPFGLATAPQVFTMIVKEVKLMALSRGLRLHQYLDDWLIRSQSQDEAQVNTQAVVDLTQSLGWIINQEKTELKPTQVFSFMGYEYHLDSL